MTRDYTLAAFLIGIGLVAALLTMQVPSSTFTDDPGPHLFPYFACAILILCGVGIAVTARSRAGRDDPLEGGFMTRSEVRRSALLMGVFVVYGIALWLVGFHIATLVMTFVFYAAIAGRDRFSLWRGLVFTLAVYGGLYVLFITFLQSYLPEGVLFGGAPWM